MKDETYEYIVAVTEILSKTVKVKATSEAGAIAEARQMWKSGTIVLTGDDFQDYDFEIVPPDEGKHIYAGAVE